MASTIKVDTIDTPSGSGNITLNRPIAGDGSNLTGIAIDGITTSANATAISIDANEIVTMPSQPAFSASMSDQTNLAAESHVKLLFNEEVFDQNADFNTSTNTFTAPVSGRYLFTMYVEAAEIDNPTSQLRYDLNTSNDSMMEFSRTEPDVLNNADSRFGACGAILANMDANDTAHITIYAGNSANNQLDVYGMSRFEGVLIC